MGLLPMDTVFDRQKTRTRVTGTIQTLPGLLSSLAGTPVEGYEIHMGETTPKEPLTSTTQITDSVAKTTKMDGLSVENVYGTYIHGVFDREEVAKAVIRGLGRQKGVDTEHITGIDFQTFKESQYDILADALRKHMDMKKIYEILETGL